MDVYGVSMLRTVCLIFVEVPGAADLEMLGNKGKSMAFPLQLPKCCRSLRPLGSQQEAAFRALVHPETAFILPIHPPS